MSHPRAERAFGLVSVLFFGLLLTMLVLSVHTWSTTALRRVSTYANQLRCEQAARSGLQVGLSRLKADPTWSATVTDVMPALNNVRYRVQFFNNVGNASPISAPDGTDIPGGMVYILSTAETGVQRYVAGGLASTGQSLGLFDFGLFADNGIEMSNVTRLASWPPSLPAPVPFQVGTNAAGGGAVRMSGTSRIDGPLMVGVGGGPGSLDLSGTASTGPVAALAAARTFTTFTPPATTGPVQSVNLSGTDDQILAPGNYASLRLSGSSRVSLTSGQYYVSGGVDLSGSSRILVQNPSGPVVLIVGGGVDQSGSSSINAGNAPSGLQLIVLSGGVRLSGTSSLRGGVYSPTGGFRASGSATIIGSLVARSADLSGSSQILYDHSLATGGGGGSAGPWRLTIVRTGQ